LGNNVRVARRFYDEPELGVLAPGAPADVIVVDASPPTPLSEENLFSHLIYGAAETPVRHTVARGQFLLKDFTHTTMDPEAIALQARELAPALWQRFSRLSWGTRFIDT
jgi:cytosine/adenosine deaminase-related metal-dependent hydrolase